MLLVAIYTSRYPWYAIRECKDARSKGILANHHSRKLSVAAKEDGCLSELACFHILLETNAIMMTVLVLFRRRKSVCRLFNLRHHLSNECIMNYWNNRAWVARCRRDMWVCNSNISIAWKRRSWWRKMILAIETHCYPLNVAQHQLSCNRLYAHMFSIRMYFTRRFFCNFILSMYVNLTN